MRHPLSNRAHLLHARCVSLIVAVSMLAKLDNASTSAGTLVVMLAPRDRAEAFYAILDNTKSELVDLPVQVVARFVEPLPESLRARERLALEVMSETRAALVFWCDLEGGDDVFFVYRTKGGHQMLRRGLEGSGKEGVADAVSLITRTTVESLLDSRTLQPTMSPRRDEPRTVKKKSPPSAPPETEEEAALRFSLGLSYVTQLASPAPGLTHGGRFSLQLSFGPVLRAVAGLEIATPLKSRESTAALERMRFPFHIGLSALAELGDWRAGGGATLVLSAVKLTPRALDDTVSVESPFYRFGLSTEIFAKGEYGIREYLSVQLTLGVEIIPEKVVYKVVNGPVLFDEVLRAQPKLMLGVVMFLL